MCLLVLSDRHSHQRRFPPVGASAGVRLQLLGAVPNCYLWSGERGSVVLEVRELRLGPQELVFVGGVAGGVRLAAMLGSCPVPGGLLARRPYSWSHCATVTTRYWPRASCSAHLTVPRVWPSGLTHTHRSKERDNSLRIHDGFSNILRTQTWPKTFQNTKEEVVLRKTRQGRMRAQRRVRSGEVLGHDFKCSWYDWRSHSCGVCTRASQDGRRLSCAAVTWHGAHPRGQGPV